MRSSSGDRASVARLAVVTALAAVLMLGASISSTSAAFTGRATGVITSSTRAACAGGTPYATLLSTPAYLPTLWWRFGNLTGTTTVADSSGHANSGSVVSTGLTFGTANVGLVTCDTTYALRQPGAATSTGFVVTPTLRPAPTTLTIATWVRTTSLTGGRIVGFGDSATAGSASQDRALLLDRTGRVVFQVRTTTGNLLLTSPNPISTNAVRLVVATLSGTSAALYVDGVRVASALVISPAPVYNGYWRAGWDQNVATIIPTSRNQAAVRQDELAVWEGRALSDTEVTALWTGNHW
jgi:large repetitive protein